jgi:nitroreductase
MPGKHPFVPLEFQEFPQPEMRRRAREFYETMRRRRSVRHFSDRPVPVEIVHEAIRTAGTSPSGAHKQPWHFALVGDPHIKRQIREAAEAEERESYEHRMPDAWLEDLEPLGTDWHKPFLTTCPWLIVVFSQPYGLDPAGPGGKKKHYYVQESVGISVGMLLTALHVAGLATLTHTPSPMGFLQRILRRPDNERAYMLVALGYPAPACEVPDLTRKALGDILTTYGEDP